MQWGELSVLGIRDTEETQSQSSGTAVASDSQGLTGPALSYSDAREAQVVPSAPGSSVSVSSPRGWVSGSVICARLWQES